MIVNMIKISEPTKRSHKLDKQQISFRLKLYSKNKGL